VYRNEVQTNLISTLRQSQGLTRVENVPQQAWTWCVCRRPGPASWPPGGWCSAAWGPGCPASWSWSGHGSTGTPGCPGGEKERIHERVNVRTHEPVNAGIHEPVKMRTHESVIVRTHETVNAGIHEPVKMRIINQSLWEYMNQSITQCENTGTSQCENTLTSQERW